MDTFVSQYRFTQASKRTRKARKAKHVIEGTGPSSSWGSVVQKGFCTRKALRKSHHSRLARAHGI